MRAADLSRTVFNDPPASRLIDASLARLAVDPAKAGGTLLFRLAEFVAAVLVHDRVKTAIEAKRFPFVVFRPPGEFVS